nr:LOW QUALITY PROTEIN: anthocyanidin 3-O-glucosyltransferase 7-like [Coffea arabica]XP_027071571.1 LOW QUALITY PROTEIN: anthocyanidin 3-O-glucosyltransferase 7-like [Coffea arabica]
MDNQESPLAHMVYNMALNLQRATAVVINSFEEIDPAITTDPKSKFKKFLNVSSSPLISTSKKSTSTDENDECLSWLDKQDSASVVYISFGTVMSPPLDEMVALAEALEALRFPFLWSLRDHARKLLPDGFIDRASKSHGKFVAWAPQVQVLAHSAIGVFVTHCGWNSILESISHGVPMICRPYFGDQKLNSWKVQDGWRIGLKIEGGVFTKNGTINAIQHILSSDKGKTIRENVQELRAKASDAVKPNGSSTRNFEELFQV